MLGHHPVAAREHSQESFVEAEGRQRSRIVRHPSDALPEHRFLPSMTVRRIARRVLVKLLRTRCRSWGGLSLRGVFGGGHARRSSWRGLRQCVQSLECETRTHRMPRRSFSLPPSLRTPTDARTPRVALSLSIGTCPSKCSTNELKDGESGARRCRRSSGLWPSTSGRSRVQRVHVAWY